VWPAPETPPPAAAPKPLPRAAAAPRPLPASGVFRQSPRKWRVVLPHRYREGVEPTNNAAELRIRHAVLLRKTSYGTHSGEGSRFVERILTVHASLRQQDRRVLEFVRDACLIRAIPSGRIALNGYAVDYEASANHEQPAIAPKAPEINSSAAMTGPRPPCRSKNRMMIPANPAEKALATSKRLRCSTLNITTSTALTPRMPETTPSGHAISSIFRRTGSSSSKGSGTKPRREKIFSTTRCAIGVAVHALSTAPPRLPKATTP
jgi:hypothetical protein